ncbi:MAG: hypothetical protein RBG13Loki_3381 [Promethearchaeota archaeon CR_4]|nr:MAG: hypothetical protein RBG13Loki_3381 [Candidatus Lokiarchaeota archaeon CR_4]
MNNTKGRKKSSKSVQKITKKDGPTRQVNSFYEIYPSSIIEN